MSGWDKYRLPPRFRDVTPHTGTTFAFIGARKPVTTNEGVNSEGVPRAKDASSIEIARHERGETSTGKQEKA
jgi:hypothetical protein